MYADLGQVGLKSHAVILKNLEEMEATGYLGRKVPVKGRLEPERPLNSPCGSRSCREYCWGSSDGSRSSLGLRPHTKAASES